MTRQERTRRHVARYVWRGNPHSVAMASVAVSLAGLLDRRPAQPGVPKALRVTLAHLIDCQATPDDLDEIRSHYCQHLLELLDRA